MAFAELLFILPHVAGIHLEQRAVGLERVGMVHTRLILRRRRGDSALPGRNAAAGITRLLGAQRCQVSPQARCLHGVDLGLNGQRTGRQQQ